MSGWSTPKRKSGLVVPRKHGLVHPRPSQNDQDLDDVERAMFNDITGGEANQRHRLASIGPTAIDVRGAGRRQRAVPHRDRGQRAAKPGSGGGAGLEQSLLRRLADVEKANKALRRALGEQTEEAKRLRAEVAALRAASADGEAADDAVRQQHVLLAERDALADKVKEMQAYLASRGLDWVGSNPERQHVGTDADGSRIVDAAALAKALQHVTAGVRRAFADAGSVAQPARGGKVARFRGVDDALPHVSVTVYQDGIFLNRGPLRPFTHPAAETFVRDAFRGFVPREFKTSHPNGVLFDVTDKSDVTYSKANRPSHGAPLSRQELLAKLPESVIKNGNIVAVRAGVAEKMRPEGGQQRSVSARRKDAATALDNRRAAESSQAGVARPKGQLALETTLQREIKAEIRAADGSDGAISRPRVTLLRVTGEDGQTSVDVTMRYEDTIHDLRRCLDKYRESLGMGGTAYSIHTARPVREYSDLAATLESVGLVPRVRIRLRRCP